MAKMRAKMRVTNVEKHSDCELLEMTAVCKSEFDETGNDENNTFAKWTPSADLKMYISNPALHNQFVIGQQFYVDFTQAD